MKSNKRKFRLGSTSYVYPDDILPNVRQLAPIVDDIELVLFEVDDYADSLSADNLPTGNLSGGNLSGGNLPASNLPDAATVAELNALALTYALTFTVHLPIDLDWRDARSFEKIYAALEATRGLDAFAYILHLDGRLLIGDPSPETVLRWQAETARALDSILAHLKPSKLCIENIEKWSPEYFDDIVAGKGLARCVDIGHLWLQGRDPVPYLQRHLERTRVIHLHGIGGPSGRDHQSLVRQPKQEVFRVLDLLSAQEYRGVLTLEVFGLEDFDTSRQVIEEWESNSL